jgi:transposase
VLRVADGKTRCEVADLLGRSVRQVAEWLHLFRNRGLDALCTPHHRGDPGNLSAGQVIKGLLRRVGASYHKMTGFRCVACVS